MATLMATLPEAPCPAQHWPCLPTGRMWGCEWNLGHRRDMGEGAAGTEGTEIPEVPQRSAVGLLGQGVGAGGSQSPPK